MIPIAISCCDSMNRCHVFSHQEAIETFKEALKLKSDFIDAYKSLGQAYRYSSPVLLLKVTLSIPALNLLAVSVSTNTKYEGPTFTPSLL